MPHLRLVEPDDADGPLREEYEAAIARAGKVFNIVKAMSLRPAVLRQSMELYRAIMHGESGLTRAERELLAVVVSTANECHYWIRAHGDDLRDEGADDELVRHAQHDFRRAELTPRVRALCEFAVKLTHRPTAVAADDVDGLRDVGWEDEAIHDAIQVIAYFNYINRIADGVGVDDEPEWSS